MNEDYRAHFYALIFCGGGGTRLWPYSREKTPKQFLAIKGKKSLIRKTFDRVCLAIPKERVYLITLPDYADEIRAEIPEISKKQVLFEPARKNTAMAAGLGAAAILKADPEAIIANIWADQVIENEEGFKDTLLTCGKAAASGKYLVTAGVTPKYPHTGLGYVEKRKESFREGKVKVFEVEKFTEKPDLQKAEVMVKSGKYLWHVGPFTWKGTTFFEELKKHAPDTYDRLNKIKNTYGKLFSKGKIEAIYKSAPDISIDYALAEKADNFLVVEGIFDWLDVGDFSVLWTVEEKNKEGNALKSIKDGQSFCLDTKNSLVIAKGERMVAVVGLEDVVVVSTDDATLVVKKDQAQKVKQVVEYLKKEKKVEFL
jgi:mannose-1-phosphate guanylyltransferase